MLETILEIRYLLRRIVNTFIDNESVLAELGEYLFIDNFNFSLIKNKNFLWFESERIWQIFDSINATLKNSPNLTWLKFSPLYFTHFDFLTKVQLRILINSVNLIVIIAKRAKLSTPNSNTAKHKLALVSLLTRL